MEIEGVMRIKEIADLAVSAFKAQQVPNELESFLLFLQERNKEYKIKNIVEIGSYMGGTLWAWNQVLPEANVISIDLGSLDNIDLESQIRAKGIKAKLLKADSQLESTREELLKLLDGPIDCLFIDADHDYDHPKREFDLYSYLIAPYGFVAFHDIVPHPQHGIYKFYEELKTKYKTEEIIGSHGWGGIGVVFL